MCREDSCVVEIKEIIDNYDKGELGNWDVIEKVTAEILKYYQNKDEDDEEEK